MIPDRDHQLLDEIRKGSAASYLAFRQLCCLTDSMGRRSRPALVRCGDRRQHRSEEPMHPTSPCPEQDPPHDRHHRATLYASLELSRSAWLVTSLAPGGGKMSKHSVAAGDGAALKAA